MGGKRRILILLVVICLLAGAGAGGVFVWAKSKFAAPGPLAADKTLIIAKGAGVNRIAKELSAAGIIAEPWVLYFGLRFVAEEKPLRAGEFLFPARVSARGVAAILQGGKTVVRRVTFAEGLSAREIIDVLNKTQGLTGLVTAAPPEGSLLPETYHFAFGDSRQSIIDRMTAAMDRVVGDAWRDRQTDVLIDTPEEAVVLASIIEKETSRRDERARVSAVFHNRLRKGMKLQSDPTVVYGITGGDGPLGRRLTRKDLKTPSAHNTYVIEGLPPTPIANPGRAAIEAALNPIKTKELFFVADGTGGHAFAETLKGHNRNVARWRRIQKQKRKSAQ